MNYSRLTRGLVRFSIVLVLVGGGTLPFAWGETCGAHGIACCNTVASTTNGVCVAPANTTYSFSIRRFGFERSDGTIVWVGSSQTFDAASVSIAADMGNFISGQSLPLGTYVALRPEVSDSYTVNGGGQATHQTTDSGTPNCSTGGNQAALSSDGGSFPSCATSPNANNCDTGDGFIRIRDTSLGSFSVTPDTALSIRFAFDVGSGVTFTTGGGNCTYNTMGPLLVTITQN